MHATNQESLRGLSRSSGQFRPWLCLLLLTFSATLAGCGRGAYEERLNATVSKILDRKTAEIAAKAGTDAAAAPSVIPPGQARPAWMNNLQQQNTDRKNAINEGAQPAPAAPPAQNAPQGTGLSPVGQAIIAPTDAL